MRARRPTLAFSALLLLSGCADNITAPQTAPPPEDVQFFHQPRPDRGTGLALESFTQGLPLVGDIQITQVLITEFSTFLGGLQASGTITGVNIHVPGLTVTEDFTTDVLVSSSGFGRCDIINVDLAPINADVFGVVGVDIPVATVSGRGSGVAGVVLCILGSIVRPVTAGAVRALVAVLNALI